MIRCLVTVFSNFGRDLRGKVRSTAQAWGQGSRSHGISCKTEWKRLWVGRIVPQIDRRHPGLQKNNSMAYPTGMKRSLPGGRPWGRQANLPAEGVPKCWCHNRESPFSSSYLSNFRWWVQSKQGLWGCLCWTGRLIWRNWSLKYVGHRLHSALNLNTSTLNWTQKQIVS